MCNVSNHHQSVPFLTRALAPTDLKAASGVIRNLLFLSPTRHLLYLSDIENGQLTGKFEHLACFFPGLLALGTVTLDMPESERQLHMWAAEGLAHSCWIMYVDQASGLGPELAMMDMWPGDWREGRWMNHVDTWQNLGRPGGKPPGVNDPAPPAKADERRDYQLRVATYLSRPEVRLLPPPFVFRSSCMCSDHDRIPACRRWKACSSCGARPGTSSGESADGKFGLRSRTKHARPAGTPVS
jgi:hypothetical protein